MKTLKKPVIFPSSFLLFFRERFLLYVYVSHGGALVNTLTLLKRTEAEVSSRYLVGPITSSLNGAIFYDMALKGPALSVCL